ncbi:MAG TPA: FkbM family methyltransferase [Chitinophagaceae bacterium]|nr:FkbM family methyltransferase [Chitinophagaceae bacterium]
MRKLGRKFTKLFLLFPAWVRLGSFRWAYRLAEESFSPKDVQGLEVKNDQLVSVATGVVLTDEIYWKIKGGLKYWSAFAGYKGVRFFGMKDGYLQADVDGIRFRIDHEGSLFIIDEIFAERLYDLRLNEELVVVDVGMNVGIASLFFAAMKNIKAVYSYEPLPDTVEQAKYNFTLNPAIGSKIQPHLCGISNYQGKISVPATVSGSAVFSTDQTFIDAHGMNKGDTVEVDIIHIRDVMEKIRSAHPGVRVLLKLDCEGEEYKIMDHLSANNYMPMIAAVALEWHVKGYQPLCDIFAQHGFSVFNLGRKEIDPPVGMIYAFNMKNSAHA